MSKPCEVCGHASLEPLFKKDDYQYERCPECKLIRLCPQPTDGALEAIYQNDYYGAWGENEAVFRDLKRRTFASILGKVPSENQRGKLLDVGAATGILMELAQEWGFEPFGVEAAKDGAAAIARKFGAERVFAKYFDQIDFAAAGLTGAFNVVTMIDLFEHVRDPNATLRQVYSLLKPKGFLLLYLPDVSSLTAWIFGKRWPYYSPQHLFSFPRACLSRLLHQHGFKVYGLEAGPKYLTLEYADNILRRYPTTISFLCPFLRLMPAVLKRIPIPVYVGQMRVLAWKDETEHA